jgi:hypothetical protein
MNELFVSYSRKDTEITRRLTERLKAEGLDAWVDWQDIPPSVDWMNEIKRGIEEANIFLFLVSPDSIASSVCASELAHGILNGKRIIPVIVREIEIETAPTTITHLNWIFFSRPHDDFDDALGKLLDAIRTDYDWVQVHKRLQVKALEWERSKGEESLLLRGKDLEDAEAQFKVNGQKPPLPTDLQLQYVEKSRAEENTRLEEERAKERQLEIEKTVGSRSRRLTYIMLAIFTVAFVALYFWLYRLVADLSLTALKKQMTAIVETTSVAIDGDQFQGLANNYSAGSADANRDPYFAQIEAVLTNIKKTNTRVDPNMSLYLLTRGKQTGEIQVIASADQEYKFKDTLAFNGEQYAQFLGLTQTSTDFEITNNNFGNRNLISACTPIRDQRSTSVGALCTDFHIGIVHETQSNVARTLGLAFLAVYPLMVVTVVITTRSLSRLSASAKKK